MRSKIITLSSVLITILIISCSPFASGNFTLDGESRMPIWFDKHKQFSRENYDIEVVIYEHGFSNYGKVNIIIRDTKRGVVEKEVGTWKWHPVSSQNIKNGNTSPPLWYVIKIQETEEIYEQTSRNNLLKIVNKPKNP